MSAATGTAASRTIDQGTFNQYAMLKQDTQNLAQKIGELELEFEEHSQVVEALTQLEGGRKCFRMVGGVMVERSVREVLPAILSNREGIAKVIEGLKETHRQKHAEASALEQTLGQQQ